MDRWTHPDSDASLPAELRALRDELSAFRIDLGPPNDHQQFRSIPLNEPQRERSLEDQALQFHNNFTRNLTLGHRQMQSEGNSVRLELESNQARWYAEAIERAGYREMEVQYNSLDGPGVVEKEKPSRKVTFVDQKKLVASFKTPATAEFDLLQLQQEYKALQSEEATRLRAEAERERQEMEEVFKRVEERRRRMEEGEEERQRLQNAQAAQDPIEIELDAQRQYLRRGAEPARQEHESQRQVRFATTPTGMTAFCIEPNLATETAGRSQRTDGGRLDSSIGGQKGVAQRGGKIEPVTRDRIVEAAARESQQPERNLLSNTGLSQMERVLQERRTPVVRSEEEEYNPNREMTKEEAYAILYRDEPPPKEAKKRSIFSRKRQK